LHYVERVNIDGIARIFQVHRATVAEGSFESEPFWLAGSSNGAGCASVSVRERPPQLAWSRDPSQCVANRRG
jgi:hypothetical protein